MLFMSKINLHISSNFFKLLCIGKRCFQPEVAKLSHIMCFMNWAPMLVQIFPWTGVSDYQKLHLVAPATADKFLIEKHMNKLIWCNLWILLSLSLLGFVASNLLQKSNHNIIVTCAELQYVYNIILIWLVWLSNVYWYGVRSIGN